VVVVVSRVAVVGGGVAGLSVAHELATRDVDVTVYEARERFGGKARSFPGPTDGAALPAEHGFRFFPGFYRHLTDTMTGIPDGDGRTVADHLVPAPEMRQALVGGGGRTVPTDVPQSLSGWRDRIGDLFGGDDVPADETAFFTGRLLQLLTSSEDRWESYDDVPWWEFVRADEMSESYRRHLAYGITQTLVAMRPERASTRTIGRIYLQLIQDMFVPGRSADRVLDGPTSDVWIDPWVEYLDREGVEFRPSTPVRAVESDGDRVTGLVVDDAGTERRVTADQYVLSVPLGVARELRTPELEAVAPSLREIDDLDTAWMNGVQFYLGRDHSPVNGHVALLDSPWALTAISQREFWPGYDFDAHPEVEGILSVAVSDFETTGPSGRTARESTREELAADVWTQVREHDDDLADDDLVDWQVDPALSWDDDAGELSNGDPLLINTVGSRRRRPDAETACPNLALAADYVRTHTDLASMESATEAGRRGANVVLDRLGVRSNRADVWSFEWPEFVEPLRAQDDLATQFGLPHPGSGTDALWTGYRRLTRGLK
jgi:uncharacterized protein with NAD-binding domain and iron-sulfur cluster